MSKAFTDKGVPLIQVAFDTASYQPKGWTSAYFTNSKNEQVFYAKIPGQVADGDKPKGTVVLNTGYNDSIYYYYDTIGQWQKRGYDIFAMDWAGQGASQRDPKNPERPSNRPLTDHVRDLDQFVREIVEPSARNKDLTLVGHSMGGNIDSQYLKTHPGVFSKAILAAPMLEFNTTPIGKPLFKGLAEIAGKIGLKNESLPNWRDALYRLQTATGMAKADIHPELGAGEKLRKTFEQAMKPYDLKLPTWGWVNAAYGSIDKVTKHDYFKSIQTPILFIAAGQDELVDNKAIKHAAKDAPRGQILELPTSRHGVWETGPSNQAKLWSAIDSFTGNKSLPVAPQQHYQAEKSPAPTFSPSLVSA